MWARGPRMWMKWWWVAVAALLAVILPPSNATLSPAGINYEGTYPAFLISKVLTKCQLLVFCLGFGKKKDACPTFSIRQHMFLFFLLKFVEKSSVFFINPGFKDCDGKRSTVNKNIK
jgi:hypothetical protein